jgi:2-keto-3-deoxy-L-rhamnonate aldolase RhmA
MVKMKWIRERVSSLEILSGTFLNLGSSLTAEMAGQAGFDWVLVDLEHGAGDYQNLQYQLQAIQGTSAAPLVRLAWNDPILCKRVLDLGPSGLMVPWINSVDEAKKAVAAMRYPPLGIRGVASMNRACSFGIDFDDYFSRANQGLLLMAQIETREAVAAAGHIAATDGVDVLFVGPLDLSVSLGIVRQFDHPNLAAARRTVVAACREHRKAAGILVTKESDIAQVIAEGFTFIGVGSDGSLIAQGMRKLAGAFGGFKRAVT